MHRKTVILAGSVVGASFLWSVLDSRSTQRASDRHVAELQAQLDKLGTALRRPPPTGAVASLAQSQARAEVQSSLDERTETEAALASRSPPITLEQSKASALEAFGQESADPQWSAVATHKLEATLRAHLPKGSRLSTIECHTTMCQVQVLHTDPVAARDFLLQGFGDWPGSLLVTEDRQEPNGQAVTILASREGHEPPLAPR